MRHAFPIIVVLVAILIYTARESVIEPLHGSEATIAADATMQAARQEAAQSLPADDAQVDTEPPAPDAVLPGEAAETEPVVETTLDPSADVNVRSARPPFAVAIAEAVEGEIGRNSSVYIELRKLDVSPVTIDLVARASRKTYNLKRVQAGQKFIAYPDGAGSLDSLEFAINAAQVLKIRRDGEAYAASIDTIPYTVTYHVTGGTIYNSVFMTLKEQEAEVELASALANIFGWTVDFITDIRRGDSFMILYERRTFEDGTTYLGNVLAARLNNRGEDHYAFRYTPEGHNTGYYDEAGKSLMKSLLRSPLKYSRVTSSFKRRRYHPVTKRYQPHYGVDYGAPRGTPIYATGEGTVLTASRTRGNGNYVKIKHNNTYTTYYLHMSRFAKGIRSGKRVKQGQLIGYVGSTGYANGSHVCYRVKRNGSWVNSRRLKLPSKEPVPENERDRYFALRDSYLNRIEESILRGVAERTVAVDAPRTEGLPGAGDKTAEGGAARAMF